MGRAGWFRAALAAVAVAGAPSCGGVDQPTGREALARVQRARYVPGAMPAAGAGPRVTALESPNNTVRPGQLGKIVSGRTDGTAFSVLMGLEGDAGYWIVPLGDRSVFFPGEIEWEGLVDFAPTLAPGRRALVVQAVDGEGRSGEPARLDLTVASLVPEGDLVVALRWDADADLNLRVVQPDGSELSPRGLRAADGTPIRVDLAAGPAIDVDSNAVCAIDGRRVENAVWRGPAPGRYQVRVETFSLCGRPRTGWTATAYRNGAVVGEASGASYEMQTPTTGQSIVAFEFDVAP